MPTLRHLPATATPGDALAVIAEDCACIVDGLMAPGVLECVTAEIMPYVEVTPPETLFSGEVKGWGDDLYARVSGRSAGLN